MKEVVAFLPKPIFKCAFTPYGRCWVSERQSCSEACCASQPPEISPYIEDLPPQASLVAPWAYMPGWIVQALVAVRSRLCWQSVPGITNLHVKRMVWGCAGALAGLEGAGGCAAGGAVALGLAGGDAVGAAAASWP